MKFVGLDQDGVNLTLHPKAQDKILTDVTDDGEDFVLVTGRVLRVDEPSFKVQEAMYPRLGEGGNRFPMVIKTEADPIPVAPVTAKIELPDMDAVTAEIAKRLGITLEVSKELSTVVEKKGK